MCRLFLQAFPMGILTGAAAVSPMEAMRCTAQDDRIWIVSTVGMTLFTFAIGYNSRSSGPSLTKMYQYEEPVINPLETL